MVGLSGLEPETSRLSGGCSNQLSYKPGLGRGPGPANRFPAVWLVNELRLRAASGKSIAGAEKAALSTHLSSIRTSRSRAISAGG